MTAPPALLALRQALAICLEHARTLRGALDDLATRNLEASDLLDLSKADLRLLDQFAYRYTRLQDDMGARLMPLALLAMGEEVAALPFLDRLDRLEQLGWLPSAEEWSDLRRIRNEFTHDYPDTVAERFTRLQVAMASAQSLLRVLEHFHRKIDERSPEAGA